VDPAAALSLAVLKHVLKIRRWKRFARISNIRGSVAPGRRTGPLFDRAPRKYRGERASQLGSSACALVVVVANMYLTCLGGKNTLEHCFYFILFSLSGQRLCGWVNERGFYIHMHVELVRLRNKNKKTIRVNKKRICGIIL